MKKRSLFDRLAGTAPLEDTYDYDDDYAPRVNTRPAAPQVAVRREAPEPAHLPHAEEDSEGQLPVDVYQTANEIVIRTFVAGVRADDLNVSISRDMVVLEGSSDERTQV